MTSFSFVDWLNILMLTKSLFLGTLGEASNRSSFQGGIECSSGGHDAAATTSTFVCASTRV